MRFYQLEVNVCGLWHKTSRFYACEPVEFTAMLAALDIADGQRFRRVVDMPIMSFRGKIFSSGRFVTLSRGR